MSFILIILVAWLFYDINVRHSRIKALNLVKYMSEEEYVKVT